MSEDNILNPVSDDAATETPVEETTEMAPAEETAAEEVAAETLEVAEKAAEEVAE